ncbi:MAG: penicillin-binding protein 2 [Hydrogenophilales bacterium]
MEIRDLFSELKRYQIRITLSFIFILLCFLVIFIKLFFLQIVEYEKYKSRAQKNRIVVHPLIPDRGKILDRNGKLVADNGIYYTLEVVPRNISNINDTYSKLQTYIKLTKKDKERFKRLSEIAADFSSIPIKIRLTDKEIALFSANRFLFPEIDLKHRFYRNYPFGSSASHLLGYLGRINQTDFDNLKRKDRLTNYTNYDFIGKSGVEQNYEYLLRGEIGYAEVETDASGKNLRILEEKKPVSGKNISLTIDIDLQIFAENLLQDYQGALVALDPNNGDVLALVSKPDFDPNLFVDGIEAESWRLLNNSERKPLNNRAIQGVYPPGSTIKPFLAFSALEDNFVDRYFTIEDQGFFKLARSNHIFRDWKKNGHGSVDLKKAIYQSCDVFFYELSNKMGINNIYKSLSQFGFGERTGIDISGEVGGLLPSKEWKKKRFNQVWYPGDTISVGIGQGYFLATPIQLAVATSIIANKGNKVVPKLLLSDSNSNINLVSNFNSESFLSNIEYVKDSMVAVTSSEGTAYSSGQNLNFKLAGKTGTSQVFSLRGRDYDEDKIQEKLKDHSLFVAFAPATTPKIALALIVENGGSGSAVAAPMASKIIDYFLKKN